ncbi:hypothetical protein PIB30_077876 [Stylosanthes scabra]|uniref:DUF4283 domain-containing protein n=1 Tax=Stylosanthes scabra TaxID=79078 RepID=A0ABU6XPL7_9FABA|nr:hypothetical protein [Stylosanthes scabra]
MLSSFPCDERRRYRSPPDRPGATVDGEEVVILGEEDISESFKLCSKSLIGRIFADRIFSACTMENALDAIWSRPSGFRVADLGKNYFQFFFDKDTDVNRIVNGSPWLFKGFILNLKKWENKVMEVDLFEVRGKENRIVKARVKLNGGKKIRNSLKISGMKLDQFEIGLRYERLGVVCLYCAGIGHTSTNCQALMDDTHQNRVKQELLGEWVKADQVGRRIFRDDFKHPAGKENPAHPGKKPPPDWLAEGFSKMNLQENIKGRNRSTMSHPVSTAWEGNRNKEDARPALSEIVENAEGGKRICLEDREMRVAEVVGANRQLAPKEI